MSTIDTITLDCGMPLITERNTSVASAALTWLLPLGSSCEPREGDGWASLLSELIFRGAGGKNSREHSEALDRLGIQRSGGAYTHHLRLGMTLLGDRLTEGLPLFTDLVLDPALPEEDMDAVRNLCLQTLASLDDDPQHRVMLQLKEQHRPSPFNRHGYGEKEALEKATIEDLRGHWKNRARPGGAILAVAGNIDPRKVADQLNDLFCDWRGEVAEPEVEAEAVRGQMHLEQETAQVHIAVGWDAPPDIDEFSMTERIAIRVLGGSTSGRLFTEVRQKRSLCYSVGASYQAGRDRGMISFYAGTTPERAEETLAVALREVERMRAGVTEEEFARTVTGLKSRLIMQGESTVARAGALASDYFCRGRARDLGEVAAAVDAVSLEEVNGYLAERNFGEGTMVSIGPAPLAAVGVAGAEA